MSVLAWLRRLWCAPLTSGQCGAFFTVNEEEGTAMESNSHEGAMEHEHDRATDEGMPPVDQTEPRDPPTEPPPAPESTE